MKAVTAQAKILKKEGVKFVTGFPMNLLHEELAKEDVRFIKFRTERVAVNVADGLSRSSFGDNIGVIVVQHGPGIENAFSGVAHAFADSVPILLLPGGAGRPEYSVVPDFKMKECYREVTKYVDSIDHADRTIEIMRRAYTQLRAGRPGPVIIELPISVANEEFDDAKFQYEPVKRMRGGGDPADIKEVVKMLLAAKNPVIRAGQGVHYAKAWAELKEFAELLAIPVYTTMNGKSAFLENHPLSLGCGARTNTKQSMHFVEKADIVFAIGSSCTNETFTSPIPKDKVLIQTTIDERDINKSYAVKQAIIGDAKIVLAQLIEEAKKQLGSAGKRDSTAVVKEIKALKDEFMKEWAPRLNSDETPINPYRVIRDLQKALDMNNTIITHDSGNPRDQMVPFWEPVIPGGYIGWGKSTTLGQGMGLAMGAKLANPGRTCVWVGGDAAIGMVGMDFEVAARENIPILAIILNNSVLGGYGAHFPVASPKYGLNILSGNYPKFAEALGAGFTANVTQPAEIIPTIQAAVKSLTSGKPALVNMVTAEVPVFPIYHNWK
jgi:acetolactate synthase I/II/III large subunit